MSILFLCGQKAAGKSYCLQQLKTFHNKETYDLDEEILSSATSEHQHETIRSLYNEIGEEAFRRKEKETLERILSSCGEDAIIALGGGALHLIDECNKVGRTIYLFQDKDVIFKRMEDAGLPPFIKNYDEFILLYNKRDAFYRKHCSFFSDIRELCAHAVCKKILDYQSAV